ncbi:MAG: hypothetical protein ABIR47_15930 [Candidatus Kapaibacterium sp.]
MRFQFIKTVLLILAVLAAVLAYPLYAWCTAPVMNAIVASAIIAFVNALLGLFALEYAIDKPNNTFMIAVFGGMGLRMGLILVTITILLVTGAHPLALSLSLMGFYVVYLVAEIIYITRELTRRSRKAKEAKQATQRTFAPRELSAELWSNR